MQKGFKRKSIGFCDLYPLAMTRLELRAFCDWIIDQVYVVDTETCNASLENMEKALKTKTRIHNISMFEQNAGFAV